MALPATRAARNAILDAVASVLDGLTVTAADLSTYTIAVVDRPVAPGVIATLPSVALVLASYTTAFERPSEVTGSRSPSEGDGTYIEKVGDAAGQVEIHIFAESADEEDEIAGAIEQALIAPVGAATASVTATATDYHGAKVSLVYGGTRTFPLPYATGVWQTVALVDATCPILRSATAADLQPIIGLTVDGDGEYEIDVINGTTTEPA